MILENIRDHRWENVYAEKVPYVHQHDPGVESCYKCEWTDLRIYVTYKGKEYTQFHVVDAEDIIDFDSLPEVEGWYWGERIKELDKKMSRVK